MEWLRTGILSLLVVASAGTTDRLADGARAPKDTRLDVIRRAQVWMPTDIPSLNLLKGPDDPRGFEPGATVTCDYVSRKLGGNTPKFACRLAPDDEVKVKHGGTNGEVYGEVIATRLLWALGFGADHMYSVRVICRGCPASIGNIEGPHGQRIVDPAAIERKMPGRELTIEGIEGWSWPELESLDETLGGGTRAQRDALKLLAAFMQHTDSKPEQQRLLCLDESGKKDKRGNTSSTSRPCARPFMMINDLGLTFGRANMYNKDVPGAVDLQAWSKLPVWKGDTGCTANLSRSFSGTLADPVITESGRAFLANLLSQLSDQQIHDMFEAARVQLRPRDPASGRSGFPSVDEWVAAFKARRVQIVERRCA